METTIHRWTPHSNRQLFWCDMDHEDRWHTNMRTPDKFKILASNGWDKSDIITYKFNSHGFRCDEFSQEPGILTLGCSFTGGVGLPEDKIWPTLVANQLNLKLWNFGVGSASMDSCFRLLNHYISKLNVKIVFFLTPGKNRFELFLPDGNIKWAIPGQQNIDNYQKNWYQNDQNSLQNYQKNIMAIRYLCQKNSVKLVEKNSFDHLLQVPGLTEFARATDRARDLDHPGALSHKLCADIFLTEV